MCATSRSRTEQSLSDLVADRRGDVGVVEDGEGLVLEQIADVFLYEAGELLARERLDVTQRSHRCRNLLCSKVTITIITALPPV